MSGQGPEVEVGMIYTGERHFMTPLIASLAASDGTENVGLILVDNRSVDGTGDWEQTFPATQVIHNEQRLGYAENLNRILKASTARYVLLMNTDMHFDVDSRCVSRMVEFMETYPDCGLASCGIYHPDGNYAHPARRFQTIKTIAARRLGMEMIFPKAIADYLCMEQDHSGTVDCDWVSGCFMMLRRETYEQVGEFDNRFAKYFEDVDMCRRVSQAGWRVMINGAARCYHHEQRGSKSVLSRDALLHLQSYLRWISKWGFDSGQSNRRAA